MAVAAADDFAIAIAQAVVTWRAVDVETFLPALHHIFRYREGELVHELAVRAAAGVISDVVVQMAASYRAFYQRPLGTAVAEETAGPQRDVFRLIVHVLPAPHAGREGDENRAESEINSQLRTPL